MGGAVRDSLKEWELRWIDTNKHLYDSCWHAEAVKGNVDKRYRIRELEERVRELERLEEDTT